MKQAHGADIVLVNPGARTAIYQGLGSRLAAVENPVWAGLMATFLRKKGHGVAIVDAESEGLPPEEVAARVEAVNPRLVAIVVYGHQPSASTQNMTGASLACTAIRQRMPSAKILMVGGHVAALPERTLSEEACDYVAHDEGLFAMHDLLEADKAGDSDLSKIRGLAYWSGTGKLRQYRANEAAPLLKSLDTDMPGIAWDLLSMNRTRAHNWHCFGHLNREPYAAIYTTLGCRACHIIGTNGGYYGPPLSDTRTRLKPGWVFRYLQNPQRWRADNRCPNYGLSDTDALRLTAYLETLSTPPAKKEAAR